MQSCMPDVHFAHTHAFGQKWSKIGYISYTHAFCPYTYALCPWSLVKRIFFGEKIFSCKIGFLRHTSAFGLTKTQSCIWPYQDTRVHLGLRRHTRASGLTKTTRAYTAFFRSHMPTNLGVCSEEVPAQCHKNFWRYEFHKQGQNLVGIVKIFEKINRYP